MIEIILLKRGEPGEKVHLAINDFINRDPYNPPTERIKTYDCNTDINKISVNGDILISAGYDKRIISPLTKMKCYNIHLSPLPKYAGFNPFYWAIKNNESEWGITFHKAVYNFDEGNIIKQIKFPISIGDTARSLFDKSLLFIPDLVKISLERILEGDEGYEQDLTQRSFYSKKSVDFDKEIIINDDEESLREFRARYFPPFKLKIGETK
jgi:methionyl-tRNA formyltransferase